MMETLTMATAAPQFVLCSLKLPVLELLQPVFQGRQYNLTLVSLNVNANNVFIQLKTPEKIVLPDPILGRTFFTIKFLNTSIGATPYCEQ